MSNSNAKVQKPRWLPGRRLLLSLVAGGLLLGASATAHAQDNVCVRDTTSDLTLNGVVAPGAASGSCAVGPVWGQLFPSQFLPANASPNANVYVAHRTGTNRVFVGIDLAGDPDLSDQDFVYVLFDGNNSGGSNWNASAFYLRVQVSPSAVPITSNTRCNQATGPVTYFRFDTGANSFIEDSTSGVASAVQTRLAYDYTTGDGDDAPIWNLEISLPIKLVVGGTTFFPIETAAPGFAIGAYVFADQGHQQNPQVGSVLRWPSTMVVRDITQQNMGALPKSLPSELADAVLGPNCFDVTFDGVTHPWEINGSPAASGDHRINRTGVNHFRVTYNYLGPTGVPGTLANKGKLKLNLHPYGATGNATSHEEDVDVEPTQFTQVAAKEFSINFPPPEFGGGNVSFVCATATLHDFQRNENKSNDSININYNYFTTSGYTQSVGLFGKSIPNLKPGETASVFLQFQSSNDPEAGKPLMGGGFVRRSSGPGTTNVIVGLGGLISLALVVIALRGRRRWRPARVALGVLGSVGLLSCSHFINHGGGNTGNDRWQIKNAKELGLEPVKGRPDWYRTTLRADETKQLELEFTGRKLPYVPVKQKLTPAGRDGVPGTVSMAVKPGQVVTVIAFGEIDLDGPSGPLPATSASGFVVPPVIEATARARAAATPFLLNRGYYEPSDFAGALIGSFDNFETSFVVGRSASFAVPAESSQLVLAANGVRGRFAAITGDWDLVLVTTPVPTVPTHSAGLGSATFRIPVTFPTWEILTSLQLFTFVESRVQNDRGQVVSSTLHPLGAAHMSIYETHEQ